MRGIKTLSIFRGIGAIAMALLCSQCTSNLQVSLDQVHLPSSDKEQLQRCLENSPRDGLLTITYDPEWDNVRVVSRTIEDGHLLCRDFKSIDQIEKHEGVILYETVEVASLNQFRQLVTQLEQGESPQSHFPQGSSNPTYVAIVSLHRGKVIELNYPLSKRDCVWLAEQVILMESAVAGRSKQDSGGMMAEPVDWIVALDKVEWMNRGSELECVTDPSYMVYIALGQFDLQQQVKHKLRARPSK